MLARSSVWVKVHICIWPSYCYCYALSLAPVNPDWFYLPGFTFLVPAHLRKSWTQSRGCKKVVVLHLVINKGNKIRKIHTYLIIYHNQMKYITPSMCRLTYSIYFYLHIFEYRKSSTNNNIWEKSTK